MADTTEKALKAPRALNASEVYARISSVNKGGAKALLFMKTSAGERVLDETYGPLGWEFGGDDVLRLWNPTGNTWVAKSNPLPQTSGITETDPFKRGCLRAGVGSELYNTPEMYIRKNFLMGWKQVTAKDASGNPTFSYQCDDYIKITGLDHDDGGAITAIHADIAHAGIIHHRAVFKKRAPRSKRWKLQSRCSRPSLLPRRRRRLYPFRRRKPNGRASLMTTRFSCSATPSLPESLTEPSLRTRRRWSHGRGSFTGR